MNHDNELMQLGTDLAIVLIMFENEIDRIKDGKKRTALIQEYDKAKHFMLKMTKCFDDMNCWFTAFGVDGDAAKNS